MTETRIIAKSEITSRNTPLTPIDIQPLASGGKIWIKRDDLYQMDGVNVLGAKVRMIEAICRRESVEKQRNTIVAGLHYSSSMPTAIVAVAKHFGMQARIHVGIPIGKMEVPDEFNEFALAEEMGAEVIRHKNCTWKATRSRALKDAEAFQAYNVRVGMFDWDGIRAVATQCRGFPTDAKRLVIVCSSGVITTGVLWGLWAFGNPIPVTAICIGHDPSELFEKHGPGEHKVTLIKAPGSHSKRIPLEKARIDSILLDTAYEAKTIPYLQPGDLLWDAVIHHSLRVNNNQATSKK